MAVAAAGTAVATSAAIFASSQQIVPATHSASNSNAGVSIASIYVLNFTGASLQRCHPVMRKMAKISGSVRAAAPVAASPVEENEGYKLPTWAEFDLARAPIYWKTMNGLPPTAGEKLKLFYNPAANKFVPNEDFEIAFNGGFNQHIMCGGEPKAMLPQFTLSRYASPSMVVTNGMVHTDCNFKFQVQGEIDLSPFLTEGLAEELSQEGAGERAIFSDTNIVITRCAVIGITYLWKEQGDRCNLDLVLGCTDPSSPFFNQLANVDDGSCPPYSDSED